ncbi:uncharacterized protein LOC114278610 [Camellia sinensis]|uniref:uncharacterized protein LOC114278610 n=1 Tax=Camellia sinensis TaxID=4442 RepID=UPI00103600A3|nr:uncharacterized protein LOC114278610 [Camellia sinensis]
MPSLPAGVFQHQQNHSFLLEDSLYCEEEQWEEEEEVVVGIESLGEERESDNNLSLFHLLVSEHDLFWEDEELLSLFPSIISIFAFGTGRASGSSLISTVNVRISESHKRNRIQVSNTKKPLFFYVNLAKRYMQQYNEVELSALGMAIATVVTVAEILKNNGFALNLDEWICTQP